MWRSSDWKLLLKKTTHSSTPMPAMKTRMEATASGTDIAARRRFLGRSEERCSSRMDSCRSRRRMGPVSS